MEHENNYVKEVLTMQGIMGRVRGSSFHECVCVYTSGLSVQSICAPCMHVPTF